MTRSDLVARVSAMFPYVNVGNVERIISIIIDLMVDKLKEGGRVELRDFGAFSTRERGKIQGRNPRNGEKVIIEAKRVPFFRAGKKLKDSVNERKWDRNRLLNKNED